MSKPIAPGAVTSAPPKRALSTVLALAGALLIAIAACTPTQPTSPEPPPTAPATPEGPGVAEPPADPRPDGESGSVGGNGAGTQPSGADPAQPPAVTDEPVVSNPDPSPEGPEPAPGATDPTDPTDPATQPPTTIVLQVPMTDLPEPDSEAWELLVEKTDISVLIRLLEAKAAVTGAAGDGMAAAGALVGAAAGKGPTFFSEEAERADALLALLSLKPEVDPQWLSHQKSLVARQLGEIESSFSHVCDAHAAALKAMPPELAPLWFTLGDRSRGADGSHTVRRTPDGAMDSVYHPTEWVYVAYKCRYLTGTQHATTGKYSYRFEISASMVDERGESVPNFRWGPNPYTVNDSERPESWVPGYVIIRMPADIKSEQDYTLQLRIKDLNDPGKRPVAQSIVIKVRTR